jgi:hypothetical protein
MMKSCTLMMVLTPPANDNRFAKSDDEF